MSAMWFTIKVSIVLLAISVCQATLSQFFKSELRVYHGSLDDYSAVNLDNATDILTLLDSSKPTCFYIFGINTDPSSPSSADVVEALLNTNNYNVVLLDWSEGAKNVLKFTPLSYALYNTPVAEAVGCKFGKALVRLVDDALGISDFFLVGHSMGAQIAAAAGRCAKKEGHAVSKIIGLDPAGPLFTTLLKVVPYLDTTCADFVSIIHTDPNGLGSGQPTGHVDYFPNYNETYTMQPGCTEKATGLTLSENSSCSHHYSYELFIASLEYPELLKAEHAADGKAWLAGEGDPNDISIIGVDATPGASGSYFIRTVATYPYGLGTDGIYPA